MEWARPPAAVHAETEWRVARHPRPMLAPEPDVSAPGPSPRSAMPVAPPVAPLAAPSFAASIDAIPGSRPRALDGAVSRRLARHRARRLRGVAWSPPAGAVQTEHQRGAGEAHAGSAVGTPSHRPHLAGPSSAGDARDRRQAAARTATAVSHPDGTARTSATSPRAAGLTDPAERRVAEAAGRLPERTAPAAMWPTLPGRPTDLVHPSAIASVSSGRWPALSASSFEVAVGADVDDHQRRARLDAEQRAC